MKLKRLIFTCALSILLALALAVTASAATRRYGDVDGDSKITASDARLALRAAVDLNDNLNALSLQAADVDGQTGITASDARLILRTAVDLDKIEGSIHVHEPGQAAEDTAKHVDATCLTAGRYDMVVKCSECGEELSRETKAIPALGHTKTLNEKKSTFSLTENNRLVYECSRCGKDGNSEPTLLYTEKLGSSVTEENILIVNHFLNSVKTGANKFMSVEQTVSEGELKSSKYKINNTMKLAIDGLNKLVGAGEDKIPTSKSEFDAMLKAMVADTNGSSNNYTWTVKVTDENFTMRNTGLVSNLIPADLKTLTVARVNSYDYVSSMPAQIPNMRTVALYENGSSYYTGNPYDFDVQELYASRLPKSDNIIKITLALKDESFSKMEDFVDHSAMNHIIDYNRNDFEVEDITAGLADMGDIPLININASQSNSVSTAGTVTYYFDADTQSPLTAVYNTEIKTVNGFTFTVTGNDGIKNLITGKWLKEPSTLDAGASIGANFKDVAYYIFNPGIAY